MTPGPEASFETPRLLAVPADEAHLPALQAAFDSAARYFVLTERRRPAPDEAATLLADADADPARRLLALLAKDGGAAVGVLDLWLHHPEPGVAHVGLLLLRADRQGRGLGREAVRGAEAALAREGFLALRLSVVDENADARAFWEALGFGEVGRLDRGVAVYEKALAG
jgi:RimJ/RimL family protein N-acetyltransferase